MRKPTSHRVRAKKAYKVANKVFISYIRLFLAKKLFGKSYYNKRIDALHEKNALRIKMTILELKGLFTKVGQLLSMMTSILPDQYMIILESLQDKAPESPFAETKKLLETELGEPIDELFSEFDESPIASASIGQVYKAKLKSGEKVAVKIQHPNIDELAEADFTIIEKLVKRLSRFIKINGFEHVYGQVRSMIEDELDYVQEAKSMELIGANLLDVGKVLVPVVHTAYCSKRVLVTTFHDGAKITDTEKLDEWKIDRNLIAERLILTYCKMILEDGIYHADPHPGNVLVNKEGDIILLDFGAVAEMNEEMRMEIPILIQAIIRKDNNKILDSLHKMGFVGRDDESKKVAAKLIDALSYFLQNEVKIENMNFKDLKFDDIKGSSLDALRKELSIKELTKTVQVPKDWILLDRTMILIMGISAKIAPELNPMDSIKPYLKKLVLTNGGMKKMILDAIKQQLTSLLGLPSELSLFLNKANKGELKVEIKNKNDERIYALGHQFILTLFILGSIVFFYISKEGYWLYGAVVFSLFLIRSLWNNRRSTAQH